MPSSSLPHSSPSSRLRALPWRPIFACGGALICGTVGASLLGRSTAAPVVDETVSPWEMAMPFSSTTLVRAQAPAGRQIRGSLRAEADITGRAPVGGAVARWLVEPGAKVQAGQPVVEISSGEASRPAPAAESLQRVAERQQVAAVDGQEQLARQLTSAQSKLFGAQERVKSAQERVAQTREMIQKLARGEFVAASGQRRTRRAPRLAPARVDSRASQGPTPGEETAKRQLKGAQSEAAGAAQALRDAQGEEIAAQRALETAKAAVPTAQSAVAQVEKQFNEDKASGADVEEARTAVTDASGKIKTSETRLETAKRDVTRRQGAITSAQNAVRDAEALVETERLKGNAVRAAARAVPSEPEEAHLEETSNEESGGLSIAAAERMANEALDESRRARREADRMQTRVDEYNRQVKTSRQRFQGAEQSMEQAQQQVFQSVPRARFTSAYAPATGTVVWISRLAREVGRGQSVFGLARGQRLVARLEDRSDAWKKLRVGQTLPSMLVNSAPPIPNSPQNSSAPTATPNEATLTALKPSAPAPALGTPATLVLTRIAADEAGKGAVLEGQIRPQTESLAPNAGMAIVASLPQEGKTRLALTVPPSALVEQNGKQWVAVLEAAPNQMPQVEDTILPSDSYQLRWREVELGRSDVFGNEVRRGLQADERVVLDPALLLAQAPPQGAEPPRIRLWKDATG